MTVNLSALGGAGQQFFDNNGNVLTGGKLWSYQAGTTTPQTTYTSASGATAHTNPIVLDSGGRVATGEIWLTAGQNYKFVLMTSANVTIATWDNITGINGTGIPSNANNVEYDPPFTGALTSGYTVEDKLSQSISVADFGAVGGATDATAAIQAAVDATPNGGILELEPDTTYSVSEINVTGKSIYILGYGATLNCTGANGAIYKTDHGNKLTVEGVSFTGSGAGIKQDATVQFSSQDELDVIACSFNMNSAVYGLYFDGGRNPRIQNCFFRNTFSGSGIYFKDTVSPFVQTCTFKGEGYVGRGIYYPGTGNGTDAGLIIRDSEILGWDKGLEVVGCDWLVIEGCTIDYNNQSIKLGSQDGANISNNYIGSLGANPALWITYDAAGVAPAYSEKIIVVNNTFVGHYEGGNTYDCILMDGANPPDNTIIANNSISFYTRAGINFNLASQKLIITCNTFAQRTGFGITPIYNQTGTGDSGVIINNNYFSTSTTIPAMNVTFARVNLNLGLSTEGQGEAVVGAGISAFNIAHGLAYTPTKSDISLTPSNAEAASKNPYINAVDATNINVGFTAATTSTAGVVWRARRGL